MSRTRRKAARYRHSVETATKAGNRKVARNLTEQHPLGFVRHRSWDAVNGWRLSRRAASVILSGWSVETRDRSGRVVYAERTPDYYVPYTSWARAVWVRPRPLPRRLRSKIRRRR